MDSTIVVPHAPATTGITVSPDALAVRDAMLENLQGLPAITDVSIRDRAVAMVRDAKAHLAQVEKDRVALKAPFLAIGRAIDDAAKHHTTDLKEAAATIERRIGQFNEKLRLEAEAEARKKREEAERIERERLKAEQEAQEAARKLEEAKTSAERQQALKAQIEAETKLETKVEEVLSVREELSRPTVPPRTGGSQRYNVDVRVVDIKALYAAQPSCVKLVPDMTQIKWLAANTDVELPGVEIIKTPIFSVRR